jgi:uncharacterized membrane protein YkoI
MVETRMKMIKWTLGTFALALALAAFSTMAAQTSEAQLLKETRISKSQAEKTALAKVPQGTIKSGELEKENGHLVWSFDIARPGSKDITEVQVDAKSGEIVAVKNENPAQQAAEARADKAKP